MFGFCLTTVALCWLAFVVTNNWETLPTILGLIVFGIGQGALVTLVFNVLVTAAPVELAGDVGSLRGTTQNLASAVGTAVAGALLVGRLGVSVGRAAVEHPELPPELVSQVDLDNVNFVSNDDLRELLELHHLGPPRSGGRRDRPQRTGAAACPTARAVDPGGSERGHDRACQPAATLQARGDPRPGSGRDLLTVRHDWRTALLGLD